MAITANISRQQLAQPARLADKIVDILGGDISEGRVKPGDRLPSESELADTFGVSRTVIREAVARLKADGLVIARQGAGVFVSEDMEGRAFRIRGVGIGRSPVIRDVFELRLGVEAEAASLAAARRTKRDVATLKARFAELARARSGPDIGVDADVLFHRCIGQLSRNPIFVDFLSYLEGVLRTTIRVARANSVKHPGYTETVLEEHRAILDAIEAGDPERARDAARIHLINAQTRLGIVKRRGEE
jgi:DNA-binding FadR family transcriptional regulator